MAYHTCYRLVQKSPQATLSFFNNIVRSTPYLPVHQLGEYLPLCNRKLFNLSFEHLFDLGITLFDQPFMIFLVSSNGKLPLQLLISSFRKKRIWHYFEYIVAEPVVCSTVGWRIKHPYSIDNNFI